MYKPGIDNIQRGHFGKINEIGGMRAVYVDNRICKIDAEKAWECNFNMLIACVYYFELNNLKRSELNWEYVKVYMSRLKNSFAIPS